MKITQEKKQKIILDYQSGNFTYAKLAEIHNISKVMAYWIVNPEKEANFRKKQPKIAPENNKIACKKYRDKKKQQKHAL